jgi:hypothetical protein
MNKKLLCAALLCGMGVAQAAAAQEFDDRWYVSASTGVNFQDKDRGTEDAIFGTLGFGKFWTPNVSVDLELNYQNPDKTSNPNLWWSQYGASIDARYHFRNCGQQVVAVPEVRCRHAASRGRVRGNLWPGFRVPDAVLLPGPA